MKTQLVSLALVALPWVASCTGADSASPTVTKQEVAALAVPEEGAPASEYVAHPTTFRLFGTQGEGATAFATLADTSSWDTSNIRVGETIGRSLQLVSVSDAGIELLDTTTREGRMVRSGEDISVRVIEHEFDRAAVESSEHVFHTHARSLARIEARYGIGTSCETVSFAGQSPCKVGVVAKNSVAARLGLQPGDLLLGADGSPVTPSNLASQLHRLGEQQSQSLQLSMARGGVVIDRMYVAE